MEQLLRRELVSIPLRNWGFFFPGHVAVWRFIEASRPGVFGELRAGYDTEPYFRGKGSEWFAEVLCNREGYLALLERILYPIVDALSGGAKERGFLYESETPTLDPDAVDQLATQVLAAVDEAIATKLLT
jgi:hypothetical protein